jgi:hypothetical protein
VVIEAFLKYASESQKSLVFNSQDVFGNTALHLIAEKGCLENVKLLVQNGGDVSILNYDSKTASDTTTNIEIKEFLYSKLLENKKILVSTRLDDRTIYFDIRTRSNGNTVTVSRTLDDFTFFRSQLILDYPVTFLTEIKDIGSNTFIMQATVESNANYSQLYKVCSRLGINFLTIEGFLTELIEHEEISKNEFISQNSLNLEDFLSSNPFNLEDIQRKVADHRSSQDVLIRKKYRPYAEIDVLNKKWEEKIAETLVLYSLEEHCESTTKRLAKTEKELNRSIALIGFVLFNPIGQLIVPPHNYWPIFGEFASKKVKL